MEDLKICKKCKGKCCKTMGCHYAPEDFEDLSFEGLKKEIDKGHISIDWWEGNMFKDKRDIGRGLFLRAKNVKAKIIDPSFGGVCSLWRINGCSLPYNKRPKGGRTLIPREYGDCKIEYTKDACARDWYEYRDVLFKLESYYSGREFINDWNFDIDKVADAVLNQAYIFNCSIETAWDEYMHELITIQFELDEIKDNIKKRFENEK